MASFLKKIAPGRGSMGINMDLICVEAGLPPVIPAERIMEAVGVLTVHG